MQNNDKKYFIPVDGTPIEVSEDVYRAYYQPIWNTRYHAQQNGECRCTKAQLWKCDGICPGCPFYAAGKKVSIDTPIGGEDDELTLGDTLADDAPSAESILMDKKLLDALYDELNRLDPDGRRRYGHPLPCGSHCCHEEADRFGQSQLRAADETVAFGQRSGGGFSRQEGNR